MATKKTTTKKTPVRTPSARKTKVENTAEYTHVGLVKNDAYLAPYEDAIRGRHEHATTMGCTVQPTDGCSVNGRLMQRPSILSVTSMTGRRRKAIFAIR